MVFSPLGFRVLAQDRFQLTSNSSTGERLRAEVNVTYDDGTDAQFSIFQTTESDRTGATTFSSGRSTKDGFVTMAFVTFASSAVTVKRGQLYARIFIVDRNDVIRQALCRGYIYNAGDISLGQFIESAGGPGYLDWVQEANDAAGNATTTINLAVANARRLVRAIVVKVHSSGDVATRTWTITLRDLADSGGPTNWSIASDTWVSPTLTLTANEEGLIHVGEHGFVSTNDAGTLAYADNSSAPNPFPMIVDEDDPVDLIIVAGAGEAADDYDVWVQYEEWIEV